MTTVAILPETEETGGMQFRAVGAGKASVGRTAGEALDALTAQLDAGGGTLLVVQSRQPDAFFSAAQQQRLTELMTHWRTARDTANSLPSAVQAELDALTRAELAAAAARANALADEMCLQ